MSKTISTEDFDKLVDEGKEDVLQYFDLENARRGGPGVKRINIDLPTEFLADLDREAVRRGITRQSLIKVWLYEKLHGDSVTALWANALSRMSTSENWHPSTSSLREAVITILESTKQPPRTSDIATKIVRSAKGRSAKGVIREEK